MIKAIIFDFDGVIGDTYDISLKVAKQLNNNITEQEFKDLFIGDIFEKYKQKFQPKDIPVFFEKQRELFTPQNLFPVKQLLQNLQKRYQLFVVSGSADENIINFLSLGNYGHYFQKILGSTTHRSKTEKFSMIYEKFHLSNKECLFVTDTVGDITDAKEANVKCIAVTWGYHSEDLLRKQRPTAIAHTIGELQNIINDLANKFS